MSNWNHKRDLPSFGLCPPFTPYFVAKEIFTRISIDKMDPSQVKIPPMKDLTADNITQNVHTINSLCEDERMKYVLERLVTHLHDFARETRLSTQEWMTGLLFLTEVGKICTDVRQVSYPTLVRELNK